MTTLPSKITKTYQPHGPLQQYRFDEILAFRCFRCGETKKSKLITIYSNDWNKRLCNGCYGRLLSIFESKNRTGIVEEKAEELAAALINLLTINEQREAELLLRTSESRYNLLSSEALKFLSTSEHVAKNLNEFPQLEWSPAIIGLCKAVEIEIISKILNPLVFATKTINLQTDKDDKDIGRIALFCSSTITIKPPELGTFAHFLQTIINSKSRRNNSLLIGAFLHITTEWTGSNWILDLDGLYKSLSLLIKEYRNRAAHIDELSKDDYISCRDLIIGNNGMLWHLLYATEKHK
jgi:hypothetical protein